MKMWTLHGALFCGEGGEFVSPGGRRVGLCRAWDSCERRTSEIRHHSYIRDGGGCLCLDSGAGREAQAQLFKVKLFSSGSPSGVRTTSALMSLVVFVTVFSTVLSSEFRNWELSAWASQVAQQWSICLAMQESEVRSLGQEKGMATRSSTLAGEIHGQRSLTGYSPLGL